MDQVRKKDAMEVEWLRNYTLIRNLYLSDMSLNDLVYWLGIFENFTVTLKAQLEYRLKKWNILKYIDCDSWKYIDQTINKRKREGKESDVLLSGKRLKQSTIDKQINHHRNTSVRAQNLARSHIQPIASSDQLIVCTPQAYLNEFEWPETLPWFKFRSKLQERLSYTQLHKVTSEQRVPVLDLLTSNILLLGQNFNQGQASHLIPRLAMNLVMGMPEYFPGEHLQTAQIITTGTTNVVIPECLKLIFYKVSNDMISTWKAGDFENLYTLISGTGLLGATDSLRRARQQDLTIRAFMHNLFRHLIPFVCFNKRILNKENPKTLVKWLLSSGQDPNIDSFLCTPIKTPLDHTIVFRQVDILEPLLKAGAVIGRNPGSPNPRSIISLVLLDRTCDNEGAHIIRLLLDHYKALTAEEMLHAAIILQDGRLFEQALDIGADVSLPIETLTSIPGITKCGVVEKETALSTAAAISIHATSVVFDLLQNRNQDIKAASFITPDVFISAACAGDPGVISFLHRINPIGFRRNARGVTPLEVAIKQGHQEAYQLLFKLYHQSSAALLLIPILTDQLDILQYFLSNGLDVNLRIKPPDMKACRFLVLKEVLSQSLQEHNSPTVLQLFLRDSSARGIWNDAIKLLLRSGALFPPGAVPQLSSAGCYDILSVALDAGGDPNEQGLNGCSALALALQSKNTDCVQLLLQRGATPQTLTYEVFEALLPRRVCNIKGKRGGCDPRLRKLLRKHWEKVFNASKDSVLDIDASIIVRHDARLKSAFSELPTYYSPSSLCCAVLVENHWVIDFLVKNRPLQSPHDILEGTAVGLAAMLGNLPLVRKLVAQLQKPETALLPVFSTGSSFDFSQYYGLDINSSHIFWHDTFDDDGGYGGLNSLSQGSPLALAASCRGTSGVLELLSHGYQPDDITWARAFSMDTLDCLKGLMDYNLQVRSLQLPLSTLSTLLRYAIRHGMEEAVVWLIKSGADINEHDPCQSRGRSPIQLAIEVGRLTIIETLLRSGSNVNAPPSFFSGVTALQCAAIRGPIGLAKQLLDAGARVNARGSWFCGRTALEGAAENGRLDIVELLLDHGALTTGPGRFQFIRAICSADDEYHAIAALLRQSRDWTDEDTYTYDSLCATCYHYFSEPRPSGASCDTCNSPYIPGQYCCDEIHMPGDDCYHYYTRDEENRYELEMQEEEESESEEEIELEDTIESEKEED